MRQRCSAGIEFAISDATPPDSAFNDSPDGYTIISKRSAIRLDPPIVGSSQSILTLTGLIARLATTDVSVLIHGESGTGKELVAQNLHSCGARRRKPLVAVNCAALNPGVLESELFGHGRGAFTGAVTNHAGLFEQAHGGTVFLDEIGELPLFVQAKLLRVLQDRRVRRVGSAENRLVDVRVVSATNSDLEEGVRSGEFRLDLFYRLNVVRIDLPPLRERTGDIPLLVRHFFQSRQTPVPAVSGEALELLTEYRWPGNVRELYNELDRLRALYPGDGEITPQMFSDRITCRSHHSDALDVRVLHDGPLPRAVGYLEESLLRRTLEQTNWNKSQSARKLGLSRQGLLKKLKRYGIVNHSGPTDKVTG